MSPSIAQAGLIYISLIQSTRALQQAMSLPKDCLQLLLKTLIPFDRNNTSLRTTLTVRTQESGPAFIYIQVAYDTGSQHTEHFAFDSIFLHAFCSLDCPSLLTACNNRVGHPV